MTPWFRWRTVWFVLSLLLSMLLAADPGAAAPPASAALPAASITPGDGVNPPRVELVRVVTELEVPHTCSIERPVGPESTIEISPEFASDRFVSWCSWPTEPPR